MGSKHNNSLKTSYAQILKSSAIIGGSSAVNILLGIVRTKAFAVVLGPQGLGLFGLFTAISEFGKNVSGLLISISGVREIAAASHSGDPDRVAALAISVRRLAVALGLIGGALVFIFAESISEFSFGTSRYSTAVMALSVAVLLGTVSAGQTALVQGMRRIGDLARIGVVGSLLATLVCIPVVYIFREDALVSVVLLTAGFGAASSWWYSKKIRLPSVSVPPQVFFRNCSTLLKLGAVLVLTALMTIAVGYLVRVIVTRVIDVEAAGLYQAAWTLAGLYVGFILQTMGADFYPRLTAASKDHGLCAQLVNEQTEIGLLIAGPGIIATLTFAPYVLEVFYSERFLPAIDLLRWTCLGMFLRIAAWPLGYVLLAKGASGLMFMTELAANCVQVSLVWVLLHAVGLQGAGIAFMGMYAASLVILHFVVRKLIGFRWSLSTAKIGLAFAAVILVVYFSRMWVSSWLFMLFGGSAVLVTGAYSLRRITLALPVERLPKPVQRFATAIRISPLAKGV